MLFVKPDSEFPSAAPINIFSPNILFLSSFYLPTSTETYEFRARHEASHSVAENFKPITLEQRDK
jgi:hypothetical protein